MYRSFLCMNNEDGLNICYYVVIWNNSIIRVEVTNTLYLKYYRFMILLRYLKLFRNTYLDKVAKLFEVLKVTKYILYVSH